MIIRLRELLIVGVILIGSLVAQRIFHTGIISYSPAPVLSAIILTWTIPRAWRYLLVIAIFSELFTTLPLGILSLTIFMPLLIYFLRGRIEADISFSFLLIILLTVLLQFITLASYDIAHTYSVPWRLLFSSWLITSAISFAACVMITNHMPQQERQNIISFTMRRRNG